MGDRTGLTAARRMRDLRVAPGHLVAGAALLVVVSLLSFLVGYRQGVRSAPETPERSASLFDEVPDDSLVDLLARVEASADPAAGMHRLSYPDALVAPSPPESVVPATDPQSAPPDVLVLPPAEIFGPSSPGRPSGG